MAEYKWEVENSELILSVDSERVAKISGELCNDIKNYTFNNGDITAYMDNYLANLVEYKAKVEEAPEADPPVTASDEVIGVITLKEAALTGNVSLQQVSKKYTLALEGATENVLKKSDAPAANWKVTDGTDTYENTKTATYYAEGTPTTWTVGQDGLSIKYAAAAEGALVAEIKGLNNGLRPDYLNVTSNQPIAFTTDPTDADATATPAVEAAEGVITIAASALPSGSALPATGQEPIKVELTTTGSGSTKYNLKLADGIAKFDATKGTATVDSVSNGKATITRTQSAGWEEVTDGGDTLTYKPQNTKTIATVSGLKSDAKTGVTVSDKTVTIAKAALDTNTNAKVSIVDGTTGSDGDTDDKYKGFALALKDATENKLGFEKIDEYWTLDGTTTAKYWNGRQEGWTLVTDAGSDDKGKIVYTEQDNNLLATISNLKNGVALGGEKVITVDSVDGYSKIGTKEGEVFTEGITVSGNNITLSKKVLTHTADVEAAEGVAAADNSTTLAQGKVLDNKTAQNAEGTATTYQLGLVSSETTTPGTKGDISLSTISEGSTKVQQDLSEGWTLKESNTKISYTAASKKDLATISGLAVSTAGEDVKIEGNTVVLTANAIGTMKGTGQEATPCSVTLTNHEGGNYTIARAEGVKEPENIPSTFKLGTISGESGALKSITVLGIKAAGYTLSNDNKTITYTPAADVEVATISNLNKIVVVKDDKIGTNTGDSNNFVEGITFDKDTNGKITGTITLKEAVLTDVEGDDKATTLDTTKAEAITGLGVTFKLALAEGIKAPATAVTEGSRKLNVTANSPNTTADGKLNIVGTLEKGWTLDTTTNKKITYTAEKTPILATISGLKPSSAVGTNVTLGTNGKITLTKDILATDSLTANSKVTITTTIENGGLTAGQTDSLKDSYKFALNENVDAPGKTVVDDPELTFPTEANGTATLVGKKSAGWELDEENNTVKYVPEASGEVVATITGLSSKVLGEAASKLVTFDSASKKVKLKVGALDTKDVTITGYDYKLALEGESAESDYKRNYSAENKTIGFENIKYWDKSGTTAKYYSVKREGWELAQTGDDKEKKITYKPAENNTLLATITNLSSDFELYGDDPSLKDKSQIVYYSEIGTYEEVTGLETPTDYLSGVSVDGNTIKLSKNVLGTTASKPMVLTTTTAGKDLTLALDSTTIDDPDTAYLNEAALKVVPQSAESAKVWELGATTKYKEVSKEFWKLTDKTITYTPQTSGTVLATITGLNPDVTEEDLKDTTAYSGTIGNVTTKGTITLNKHALNSRNVTINSNYYKLALNAETGLQNADKRVDAPKLENAKWSLNDKKTIAYYKAKVSEGYEATSDGSSVIYTAAADSKEIAKVTGLSGDKKLDVSDDKSYIGILNESNGLVTEGLKLGTGANDRQITLTKDVLGTSNLAVTGTNYTLALGVGVSNSAAQDDVWRVSGTTATYKKVTKAYYDLNTNKTAITYMPEADVELTKPEGGTTKTVANQTIYATVTGLKRGLTVADDGKTLNGTDENGNAASGVLTLSGKAVTLTKDALGTSNVEVKEGDAAGTDKYTLAFTTAEGKVPSAPKDGTTFTWSVSGTTATLKGTATAGYTLDTVANSETKDKKIIYTPANANKTFATLTGLKSGITASELNTTDDDKPIDIIGKVLTLDMRVLGESTVTLDKTNSVAGYTLALEDTASSNYKVDQTGASKKVWTFTGNVATYKNVTDAHYTLGQQEGTTGNVKDKIAYVERKDATTNAVIATITGLKTGLKVENDAIAGITQGVNDTTFTISKDVLANGDATITGTATFTLADGVAPERDGGTFWTISGGTNANYQFKQTAGHLLENSGKTIKHYSAATKTIVTIEGLKSGIKLADVESGILVSQDEKKYTMTKNVLGTNATTTLKNGDVESAADFAANYKFVLATGDDAPATSTDTKYGWVKNGNDFELRSFIMPRYELTTGKNDQEIKYTSWDQDTLLATVTGLNTKAKLNTATRAIDGITIDSTGHKVTLEDASVFSGKNVTIAKATNAATEYTLDVDSARNPQYSYEWTFKKGTGKNTANEKTGTATLTETMSAGYTLDSTENSKTKGQIVYHKKDTVTTTIAGLNNNVEVSKTADGAKGNSIGIKGGDTYTGITFNNTSGTSINKESGAIHLGANVLAEATVTLTNKSGGGKYTLKLDDSITQANVDEARWFKSNDTTAVYQTVTAQGYKETDDTKITYYSNSSGTPTTLATLKGLKNGFTEAQLNNTTILEKHDPETQSSSPNVTGNNADPEPTPATTTTPGNFTIKSNAILTNTNLTLTGVGEYKDYQLLLADDDSLKVTDIANKDATWTYSKGTANLNVGKTEGWSNKVTNKGKTTEKTDYKTIVYTKPAPVTIATVSGLAAPTKQKPDLIAVNPDGNQTLVDSDGKDIVVFEFGADTTTGTGANEVTTHNATITLSANALTNKNVTVTIPKKITGYAFKLDTDGDVFEPDDGVKYWTADGKGKAIYQYDTTAGYTLNEAATTLAYAKAKTTTLATITGLDKTKVGKIAKDVNNPVTEIEGIGVLSNPETTTVEGANKTTNGKIKLWDDSLLGNKVTVTGNYEFELADEIKVKDGGSKWYFSGGTATYRGYTTAGYEFATTKNNNKEIVDNPKVVNKKAETAGTTYVTVKGLAKKIGNKDITADMVNEDDLLVVNEDHTVTISKDITGTATITLVNGVETPKKGSTPATYYDYQIDAANSTYTTRVTDAPVWTFNKGTATLKQKTSAGFTLGDLGTNGQQKLTYSKEANPTVATVKGLNTNLIVDTDSTNAFTDGEIYATTTTKSGSTTTTTITGTAPALSYDANEKIITISQDALTTKNVSLTTAKTDGYKLALNGVTNAAKNETEWVVTNGKTNATATYKNYDKAYHKLNDASTGITYFKPKDVKVYATVKGLALFDSNTTDLNARGVYTANDPDDLTKGGTLKLDATHLGTSTITIATTLKNTNNVNGFSLALDTGNETVAKTSSLSTGSWSTVSGGKSTLSGTKSKGFYAEFGGKTLTYLKDNKAVTIATITGVKGTIPAADGNGKITLTADNLTGKNVTITTAMGDTNYTLNYTGAPTTNVNSAYTGYGSGSLDANNPLNPKGKTPGWTISKKTGTLKGYVTSEGYTLSESGTTLTYTGKTAVNTTKNKKGDVTAYTYKDTTTLATIKGLKTTADKSKLINSTTSKIILTKANTNGDLTINGGTFAVEVAADYAGKTITGSAGADDLTVEAKGKTITGGKGDDKIDLGSGGNTFVYNNGDGNDVIANFTAGTDKLQVNSGAISVGMVGTDVVVKVGAGSIKLDNYSGTSIDIYDKNNNKTTYAIAGATSQANPLLVDDNYSMDAASLSEIVKGDSASFTPYDFSSSFSLTKEDKLTPQISYSGNDKK